MELSRIEEKAKRDAAIKEGGDALGKQLIKEIEKAAERMHKFLNVSIGVTDISEFEIRINRRTDQLGVIPELRIKFDPLSKQVLLRRTDASNDLRPYPVAFKFERLGFDRPPSNFYDPLQLAEVIVSEFAGVNLDS